MVLPTQVLSHHLLRFLAVLVTVSCKYDEWWVYSIHIVYHFQQRKAVCKLTVSLDYPPFSHMNQGLQWESNIDIKTSSPATGLTACRGNITQWGVDLNPDGTFAVFLFILQVWRPLLNFSGCYTLVSHTGILTTTTVNRRLAVVSPSQVQHQIQFQSGDVLGFYVESSGDGTSDHDNME